VEDDRPVTLVTISALYGAGGSVVAPALADRLAVPFLGRPELGLPDAVDDPGPESRAGDEWTGAGRPRRLLSRLTSIGVAWGTPPGLTAEDLLPDAARRREIEQEIHEMAATGSGVILGRGAAIVLHEEPSALHVLLEGPVEARVKQAMAIEGIDRATAEDRLARVDRMRRAYVNGLYGIDPREAGVFHVTLDSTALPLEACVDLIAQAAAARTSPSL
jgi:cytidylate kinase